MKNHVHLISSSLRKQNKSTKSHILLLSIWFSKSFEKYAKSLLDSQNVYPNTISRYFPSFKMVRRKHRCSSCGRNDRRETNTDKQHDFVGHVTREQDERSRSFEDSMEQKRSEYHEGMA